MGPTVLVDTHFRSVKSVFEPADLKRLHAIADVIWCEDGPAPPEAVERAQNEAVAVVSANWPYGPVAKFQKLRTILEVSGRFPDNDTLDYAECFARGIRILSCAPSFGPIVAEMALALALASRRDIVAEDAGFRSGTEKYFDRGNQRSLSLFGETVGLIGYGSIARALCPLLKPFGCHIQVCDPYLADGYLREQGVVAVGLEDLLKRCKVIFVLASPNESNKHMLNRERLSLISRGSLLVMVSRAHVADFEALTELLAAGRFSAAIDVFPKEPIPADDPLRKLPNTILSGHRAGGDMRGYPFIGRMVVNDLEAVLAGRVPQQMQVAQPETISTRGLTRQ